MGNWLLNRRNQNMTASCDTISYLQWASAAAATLAAFFWLLSSIVKLPPDQITWEAMNDLVPAMRRQGRRNAVAAIFAGIAASIQAVLIMMPTCIKLS
jgi:hypothetical protein